MWRYCPPLCFWWGECCNWCLTCVQTVVYGRAIRITDHGGNCVTVKDMSTNFKTSKCANSSAVCIFQSLHCITSCAYVACSVCNQTKWWSHQTNQWNIARDDLLLYSCRMQHPRHLANSSPYSSSWDKCLTMISDWNLKQNQTLRHRVIYYSSHSISFLDSTSTSPTSAPLHLYPTHLCIPTAPPHLPPYPCTSTPLTLAPLHLHYIHLNH